ncbi:hypothetical protein EB169_12100 [archaeon]|nr:hypothetical protein [archaeon]
MRYFLLVFLAICQLNADTYTIKWENDDQVEGYSMDILCLETGFSTFKRYGSITTSVDVDLGLNQTYKIVVFASSKNGGLVPSNTLTIKTSQPKLAPRLKAPRITATKK